MAITRAQAAVHTGNALTGTTLNLTYNGIAASSLVCLSSTNDTSGTAGTVTVKDDLAVSGTARGTITAAFNQNTSLFYFANYGGGNRTFTQTLSVTHTNRALVAQELAGAATSPADGVASSSGTSATPTSTALVPAPSVDGTYIFASCNCANQPTFASPFSEVFQDTTDVGDTEDLIQGTAASISATWTQTSGAWVALAASFKPAATSSSVPGNTTQFLMLLGLGT